ncbi:MAG TPA: PfkB family carbohydrate kinase [Ktedonobacterales bacterium]|nr:PfkB family carbohydrate kinase [Ktedonobacterales bacterium]
MADTPQAPPGARSLVSQRATPDALIVGHLTRDLVDGGWRLGGPSLYAARTASLRGLRVAVVTSASTDVAAAARAALPGVALRVIPSPKSTTFENLYHDGGRRQFLRAIATPLRARDIPSAWRAAPIALLAPVAQELDPSIAAALRSATLGIAPQGWLRAWDEQGRVRPTPLSPAARALLASCSSVILSCDDLTGPGAAPDALAQAEQTLREWAARAPCLVVTHGREGADLWRDGRTELFPAFPAREVDPTGAGDVFAMTLLCALADGATPEMAMTEASQVAALSVEGIGMTAIPTPDAARAHFTALHRGA